MEASRLAARPCSRSSLPMRPKSCRRSVERIPMTPYRKYFPIGIALASLIVLWLTFFSVKETEFVLVTQFGKPVRAITEAGLHAKWAFQGATWFDRRLRVYN